MSVINDMFRNGETYHQISENLREMGVQRGNSETSVQRLLAKYKRDTRDTGEKVRRLTRTLKLQSLVQ